MDKDGNVIQKPTCINAYNHTMVGVDLMDQQLGGIDVLRRSYTWYKKLFLRLVMQCALSAHKLYRLNGGKDVFLYFLLDICTQLLLNAPRLESSLRRPVVDNIARLTERNHWPGRREIPTEWKRCQVQIKEMQSMHGQGKEDTKRKGNKNCLDMQRMSWWTRVVCVKRLFWNIPH